MSTIIDKSQVRGSGLLYACIMNNLNSDKELANAVVIGYQDNPEQILLTIGRQNLLNCFRYHLNQNYKSVFTWKKE